MRLQSQENTLLPGASPGSDGPVCEFAQCMCTCVCVSQKGQTDGAGLRKTPGPWTAEFVLAGVRGPSTLCFLLSAWKAGWASWPCSALPEERGRN